MNKKYVIMSKYFIEGHYNVDELLIDVYFDSEKDALEYLENISINDLIGNDYTYNASKWINEDETNYMVFYYNDNSPYEEELFCGDGDSGWFYVKELSMFGNDKKENGRFE